MSARDRGWGPGWPNCQWGEFVTLQRDDGLRIPVRREMLQLTAWLIDLTELSGYNVLPGQTWGVACRAISGTSTASNHSWGLAVDINAPSNPYASRSWHARNARGTRPYGLAIVCDIPESVVRMWEDHGFRWGGKYNSHPDPMHFEFMGTPAEMAGHTSRLRGWLGSAPTNPTTKPEPEPTASSSPTKEEIMSLPQLSNGAGFESKGKENLQGYVRNMQGLLIAHGNNIEVDGFFGGGTESVLTDWQRRTGELAADGICGPATWVWLTGVG